jgi:hydrogenase maturation protease
MSRVLIIAYGNPLRSDDGVAWRAAELLRGKFSDDEVELQCLQQLGPELAESASRCECMIFVDAAAGKGSPGEVQVTEFSADSTQASEASRFCHALPPSAILGLSERLYGSRPRAYCATITGESFEHGESLSAAVTAALPSLVARVEELVQRSQPAGKAKP